MPTTKVVLLLEDDAEQRRCLEEMLQLHGIVSLSCATAEQAARIWEAHQEIIDFALLDIQLPTMDGMDAYCVLEERGFSKPAIFMTGGARPKAMTELSQTRPCAFLPKPFSLEALKAACDKMV
jgi:DNA-binding NtrC family response regulator